MSKCKQLFFKAILVHVALNANELCWPRPSLPWSDNSTVYFSREWNWLTTTLLGKAIGKDS